MSKEYDDQFDGKILEPTQEQQPAQQLQKIPEAGESQSRSNRENEDSAESESFTGRAFEMLLANRLSTNKDDALDKVQSHIDKLKTTGELNAVEQGRINMLHAKYQALVRNSGISEKNATVFAQA